MIKKYLLFLFMFVYISAEANYCIQVLTANRADSDYIFNEAKSNKYKLLHDVRIESRGRYLVFRIGDYTSYNDAQNNIDFVREINQDAYIRKCDFVREQALYIQDENSIEKRNTYYREPVVQREVLKPIEEKKQYKKQEELTYKNTSKNDSLWGDCKKCFIPIYEEEPNLTYPQDNPPSISHQETISSSNQRNIEVKIQKEVVPKTKFWNSETVEEKKRISSKNKFNIDEQFLP